MLYAAVHKLFVDLVRKPENAAPHAHRRDFADFLFGIHRARGITRGIENQQFRFRRDRAFQLFGGDFKAVFAARGQNHGNAAAKLHRFRISEPVGSGNNRFVAVI